MAPGFGDPTSAWWYYGTLRPITATRFNVQQVRVRDRVWLEVFHDSIAMWSTPGPNPVEGPDEPRDMFSLVLGAYALLTGVAIDWSLDGWIEAKAAKVSESVLGIIVDRRGHKAHLSARSHRSVAMRRAVRLAVKARQTPGYRLALRDMYAAYHDPGDDAFVFAHRALEDVARAVSGLSGYFHARDWQCLHSRLQLSKSAYDKRVERLEWARHAVAHPKPGDPHLAAARKARTETIAIGRDIVAETMASEPGLPLQLAWIRRGQI